MEPQSANAETLAATDLQRIKNTLLHVARELACTDLSCLEVTHAENGDPTTQIDKKINQIIHETLPQSHEGWLSEETRDDPSRLACRRLWVVDPIDGTREFVEGIPEWAVSIGLVTDGQAVAGGVLNPCTGELFLGSAGAGLEVLSVSSTHPATAALNPGLLVSRREHREHKWRSYEEKGLPIRPVGSIAYRLARVAAGLDYATCTFEPRSEWDVAGGVALMLASGGDVETSSGEAIRFNKEVPKLNSFFAFAKDCPAEIPRLLRSGGRP